jgi:acetolactate synthase-1/2/3 large subunit
VLVSVPMDIFSMEIDTRLFERLKHHTKQLQKPSIDDETAEKIVRTLTEAPQAGALRRRRRPAGRCGGGTEAVRRPPLLPVAHSLMGKGVLPDDHPLTLGMTGFWGTKFVNDSAAMPTGSSAWAPASPRPTAARGSRSTPSASRRPS